MFLTGSMTNQSKTNISRQMKITLRQQLFPTQLIEHVENQRRGKQPTFGG